MAAISTTYNKSEEEDIDRHDEVVLKAKDLAAKIADDCGFFAYWPVYYSIDDQEPVKVELEYELTSSDYVDLAVSWGGQVRFLMEVKSKREAQSASGWARQVKRYEKASKVPVILVIAHDLGDLQKRYLKAADIHVVDLRRF